MLNGSTAQRLSVLSAALWTLTTLTMVGCDGPIANSAEGAATRRHSVAAAVALKIEVDAGIVFTNRPSYLCLPLERVGLPVDARVDSRESSCECVRPKLVRYQDSSGGAAPAILLRFFAEDTDRRMENLDHSPASLGVESRVTMENGMSHEMIVNVLEAYIKSEGQF